MARKRNRSRNRKRGKRQNGFLAPAPFAGAIVFAATVGIVYVWLGCRCQTIGQKIRKLEETRTQLEQQVSAEEYKWAKRRDPRNILRKLDRYGIKMIWPHCTQVVRMGREDLSPARGGDLVPVQEVARLDTLVRHE